MAEHPNVQRMRDGYDAFAKGDFATMDELILEEVRWHVPGRSSVSGTYEGRAAVYEFFRRLMEETEGSFSVHLVKALADEEDGMAVVNTTARRGARSVEAMAMHHARLRDGRIAEFWEAEADQYAVDELFG